MSNVYLASFASNTMHDALIRITNQAKEFELFDTIFAYTEADLMKDTEFWNKHSDFILSNPRGYGYWIWKPYLIKKTLEQINDGDILLYLDVGCELNIKGSKKLLEYIEDVKNKKFMGTSAVSTEIRYTKMDLLKFFNVENNKNLLRKKHMQSGCLLMTKCKEVIHVIDTWNDICFNNYHLIDDTPSIETNNIRFKDHRHDQSVLNMIVKTNNMTNYDLDPTEWGFTAECFKNNPSAMEYPIWYCRNKTGVSFIPHLL